MPQTILIVDDKASVTRMLSDYFTAQGFRSVVAANGRDALFAARHEKPDLILLDIMMPEMDGYDFIRSYRKESNTPIILLTAKLEETDKVVGLELGADDYVTKPFGMAELLARVRAVLRRSKQEKVEADVLRVSDVTLEKKSRVVKVGERAVDLTPSEFDLLVILMTTPGRVFSRSELLEQMQGYSFAGVERTIDVHVRNLRTKIEIEPSEPRYIETVFGVGYRFKSDDRHR
ncbi:MAG: response regulator transcription factor [Chloroflexi bacterium]|nr:response regulator transcription factor [Chloroflexota bacterium]MBI5348762.1 response regulator transcription factor [Chloroflexota bacterium]MBI5712121.1 response regulator transcription factor [Chloroflexota bacterium]